MAAASDRAGRPEPPMMLDATICRERPVYRTRVAYDVQRWLPPGPAVSAVMRGGWSVLELK
jgi:hypothetical protein